MLKQPVPFTKPPEVQFPFGPDFQVKLLKLILTDEGPMDLVMRHVRPQFFATPETRWVFAEVHAYWSQYGQAPTVEVLHHLSLQRGGTLVPTLGLILQQIHASSLKEAEWLKAQLVDWAQQNHFYAAYKESQVLWNTGKRTEAIDVMRRRSDELQEIMWRHKERVFYAEDLARREQLREQHYQEYGDSGDAITTGIPDLDKVLGGGLSPGELGIWIAYAKGGKSTLLMNLGAMAAQVYKNVCHFVLEGSTQQVLDRYDAFFAQEAYWKVKIGKMDPAAYNHLFEQLKGIKQRIVVIGLLEKFDYTILDVNAELLDLRRVHGWRPDLVIIDYGDLLEGRHGPYQSPWMGERDAFRDIKLLSNRGYAVWTASQARRPDTKNYDTDQHLLKVAQVAGAIEKARVCDFIGSLNSTIEEKEQGVLRLFAEMYRDNQAGKVLTLATEPEQMRFVGVQKAPPSAAVSAGPGVAPVSPPLGYVSMPGYSQNGV